MIAKALTPSEFTSDPPIRENKNRLHKILLAPATYALMITIIPFLVAVFLSFTNYSIARPAWKFVAIKNYITMFKDPIFWEIMATTFIIAAIALVGEFVFGFLITMLLNREGKWVGFFRSMLLLPLMLPPVISGLMWKVMLSPSSGPVNYLFGLGNFPWFATPWSARFVVAFVEIWSSTAFVALILISGMQALPKEPFEAAQVDGANYFFVLRKLTIPMLRPFILIVLLFKVIDVIKLFDIVFATTGGGPQYATSTISIYIYKEVYKFYNLGSAIAKSLFLWIINFFISSKLANQWRRQSVSSEEVENEK